MKKKSCHEEHLNTSDDGVRDDKRMKSIVNNCFSKIGLKLADRVPTNGGSSRDNFHSNVRPITQDINFLFVCSQCQDN